MEFNSQICTTGEQSKRLLALGLKRETADMVLLKELTYDENSHCLCDADTYMIRPIDYLNGEEHRGNIPSWSLHRLIEMADTYIEFSPFTGVTFQDGSFSTNRDNDYDAIVDIVEWLIQKDHFNKEYLEE